MSTVRFITSPRYILEHEFNPTDVNVFLAGPILGTWDWQGWVETEFKLWAQTNKDDITINIFNPRRPEFTDLADFTDSTFYEQVDWEHHHLAEAQRHGITLFWLANKTKEMPHRNYGLTTLFELGEIVGNSATTSIPLVVGIEPGFTNEKYLRYTIADKAPNAILTQTLKDTVEQVINEITK